MRPTRQCGGGTIQHSAACCSVTSLLPSCTSVMESHMESPNLSLEGNACPGNQQICLCKRTSKVPVQEAKAPRARGSCNG